MVNLVLKYGVHEMHPLMQSLPLFWLRLSAIIYSSGLVPFFITKSFMLLTPEYILRLAYSYLHYLAAHSRMNLCRNDDGGQRHTVALTSSIRTKSLCNVISLANLPEQLHTHFL
ncbi:hypothetical protein BJX63DRAFT_306636 [Aspergillus granulosus]|uniref:Uncharacterized protein n=1 Tax=Aspergillus granulosus TaxID=176169 RepID=A0ABR4H775_9EURO